MEEENIKGNTIFYIILQLTNFLIGLFGFALLILSIYLWVNIKHYNSLVLSFIFLFIVLTCISITGCYTKYSPTTLIIYFLLNFVVTLIVIVFTFYLFIDQSKIIDFILDKVEDKKTYDELRIKFDKNLDSIQILFMSFTIVFV
jgi:hypothetical protein